MSSVPTRRMVAMVALGGLSFTGLAAFLPATGAQAAGTASVMAVRATAPVIAQPALPAVAASLDPAAQAAGQALWALWFDDPTYGPKLQALVPQIAWRAQVSPELLTIAWRSASKQRMIVVLSALTQLGVPYRRYKSLEGVGFDCSGLTAWAWSQSGIELPHYSKKQVLTSALKPAGTALPGDLLYYPGHVMLAIGVGDAIIHAPYSGSRIEVRPMWKNRERYLKVASPIG